MTIALFLATHALCTLLVMTRVIMQRPRHGVALAWIVLTVALPFLGAVCYGLVGERRISAQRIRNIEARGETFVRLTAPHLETTSLLRSGTDLVYLDRDLQAVATHFFRTPAVIGNSLSLHDQPISLLQSVAADIGRAERRVLVEFYIWHKDGVTNEVLNALMEASRRGVQCFLLVDAVGAAAWLRSEQPAQLRAAGVSLRAALPTGPSHSLAGRSDLRLHRKIVAIDDLIAWTGSMNMVDPRFFKRELAVGEWTDAMVRIEGPAASLLSSVVASDWLAEGSCNRISLVPADAPRALLAHGMAAIQVLASGPGETGDALLQVMLSLINRAKRHVVITTPYFIPEESLTLAMRGAAARGVTVVIILPKKNDSMLVHYASWSHFDELMEAGVEIRLFSAGLLHVKSIRVDDDAALFGTANFDMRSLWLNYEISLLVQDKGFVSELRTLQDRYVTASEKLSRQAYLARPYRVKLAEAVMRLASPLL